MRHLFVLLGFLASPLGPALAQAPEEERAGRVLASVEGRQIELPLLESQYSVTIEGDMATVEVTQTFENPSDRPLEAEYLFPLNQLAAVYGMEMYVGDEVIHAVIREKEAAEAEFTQAKEEGKAAALLTQHRPNMFTQRIANLMPGLPVEVTLRYVQMVPKVEGQYQLVIPLIVGPRYEAAGEADALAPVATPDNTWTVSDLPAYPGVAGLDLPETIAKDRVSLDVTMTAGVSLADFGSLTHALDITEEGESLTAHFAEGKVLDNRDLVLHYALGGTNVEAAALSHTDERGGFLSLMIEPPQVVDEASVTPRELVFVLDTSGSMNGAPMVASKVFMQSALKGLRPGDYFRIIPFSNDARQMSAEALPATPANLRAGDRFVRNLTAGGGTEIDNAIRTAFGTRQPDGVMRIVVFLSDGYIGDEATVLKTIRRQIGDARIYAFGIGNSVNRYLLDGMADEGRGYARYVGVDEDAYEVASTLAANLNSPVLTDISVDWGDLDVSGLSTDRLPDLFAGNALRLYARHDANGPATVTVRGLVNGRPAEMPVTLSLTADSDNPALPLIWARNRIAMLERNVAVDENAAASDREITELGLAFSLQTKNTSFLAVSQQVVNNTGQDAERAAVPLPMVSGVEKTAYPTGFNGSSTPEPETLIGFLAVLALSVAAGWRRTLRRVQVWFKRGIPSA